MNLKKLFRKTIPNEWALSNLWHQKSRKCKMWCLLFRAANCISDVVMNSCWNGKGENAHLEEKKRGRERERGKAIQINPHSLPTTSYQLILQVSFSLTYYLSLFPLKCTLDCPTTPTHPYHLEYLYSNPI